MIGRIRSLWARLTGNAAMLAEQDRVYAERLRRELDRIERKAQAQRVAAHYFEEQER